MSPRLPALMLLAVLGGSAFVSTHVGARPTLESGPAPVAGVAGPTAQPAAAASSTWYCAGGTAQPGGFADHTVMIANTTDHEVTGVLTVVAGGLVLPGGPRPAASAPVERPLQVAPGEQVSVRLADLRNAELAAAVVELDSGGVVVEHRVEAPNGNSDVAPCATGAASTWHFGWGSTSRDAREILVLFNPFPSDVTVDGTFSVEGGVREPLRWQGLVVPSGQVVGIDLGDDVTRRDQVSASIQSREGLVVVDRIQSFDGTLGHAGLSLALGQPAPQVAWGFADGRVSDSNSERVVLYNPGDRSAEVDVTVVLGPQPPGTSPPAPFGVVVRAQSYEVVDFAGESRVPRDVGHSTVVRSRNGVPVVAERVAGTPGRIAGGPGSVFASTSWILPSASGPGPVQRLVVVNPHPTRKAHVTSPAVAGHGTELAPGTRVTVDLPADTATDAVLLRSDVAVVAERVAEQPGSPAPTNAAVPIRPSGL